MISVVVPAFNAAGWLGQCLDSVLAQTCCDWECIVVDDGSIDSTAAVARGYAREDGRFRVLTKPNGGLSDARNHGLAHCRGEWVTFVDADDCLYPQALEMLMHWAASTGAPMAVGRAVRGGEYRAPRANSPLTAARVTGGVEATRLMLHQRGGMWSSVWRILFDRSLLGEAPFAKGLWYEDLELMARLLPTVPRVAMGDDTVYFYRRNPGSFLAKAVSGRLDVLKVTAAIERRCALGEYRTLLAAARDRRLAACFNMYCLMASAGRGRGGGAATPQHWDTAAPMAMCWAEIKRLRLATLLGRGPRLKNRLGALASYLGPGTVRALGRLAYGK